MAVFCSVLPAECLRVALDRQTLCFYLSHLCSGCAWIYGQLGALPVDGGPIACELAVPLALVAETVPDGVVLPVKVTDPQVPYTPTPPVWLRMTTVPPGDSVTLTVAPL